MHGLVDADSLVYAAGFASEKRTWVIVDEDGLVLEELTGSKEEINEKEDSDSIEKMVEPEPIEAALGNTKSMLNHIIDSSGVDTYELFLTDSSSNFRLDIDPEYKANRKYLDKPIWFETIRTYLQKQFNTTMCRGYEADDALAMKRNDGLIISIDKDLETVPCHLFSWATHNKEESYKIIDEETARWNFWLQTLTGDKADNIHGVKGIGPKKAERILAGCTSDREYYDTVLQYYDDEERLIKNCRLLYLLRSETDYFEVSDG